MRKNVAIHAREIKELCYEGQSRLADSNHRGVFTRLCIEIDMSKPILHGMFLRRANRKPVWIYLKYEKLPNVCYRCGLLNHDTRQCKTPTRNVKKLYGGWLKAEDQSTFTPEWSDELSETSHLVVSPAEAQTS